jgi:putative DNA primase/helicase
MAYSGFLALARWITKYGVPVVPGFPNEKFSRFDGWPELATLDDKQLQRWHDDNDRYNVIAVAKKGTVCICDIDDPTVLAKVPHPLPDTLKVKTPGGGYHVYFLATPESDALGNANVKRIGEYIVPDDKGKPTCLFELKVHDATVAAPGSLNAVGTSYKPIQPVPPALLPIPTWLVDWVVEHRERPRISGDGTPRKLHPDFEPEDWFEWYQKQGVFTVGDPVDKGDFDLYIPDHGCIFKGAFHSQSEKTGFLVYKNGGGFAYKCFAGSCEGEKVSIDGVMDYLEAEGFEPYPYCIYEDEDDEVFLNGVEMDDPQPEPESEPEPESTPEPGTVAAIHPQDQRLEIEGDINLTDLGNAKRLVKAHGHNLHHCQSTKKWYLWSGKRWVVDDKGRILRLAAQVVQEEIAKEIPAAVQEARMRAEEFEKDADEAEEAVRKRYRQWILASESKCALEAMVGLAKSEKGISVRITDFDQNSDIFNVGNGTIDLKTGYLYKARRSDLNLKTSKVVYDPKATCPKWEQFLKVIFNGNTNLIEYIQRVIGYSLTANTCEQCYFLMYGTGANGKSTLLKTIAKLMGEYAQAAEFSSFIAKQHDAGIRNDLACLCGARMVTASESDQNKRMSEGVLKQLTGEDAIKCRFLYGELFEYFPTFKLFLATNHKPKVIGQDYGFWRRVRLIPFTVTIPKEAQNKRLNQELEAELSGILNWALEGLRQWREQGLNDPKEVLAATQEYRDEEDALQLFIEEECEVSTRVATQSSTLYRAYNRWVKEAGEFVMGTKEFSKRLQEKGFVKTKRASGFAYQGIGLRFHEELSDKSEDELVTIN